MKQNKERPGVMIYFHIFEMLKLLDTQQVGEVMLALMAYAKDGIEPQFREQVMQIVWVNMKNASDVDREHYEMKRQRAIKGASKRWHEEAMLNDACDAINNNNPNTETDTESVTETNTKADADAVTQASASANTETEKETPAAAPQRREMPPLETPPAMANSPSYQRMVEASKHRPTPEEHEQRKAALIQQLLQHPA
ncbi:MAG: hypothetical protein IKK61_09450 [Clostridia bacterium]|nr:hypothetical protein [Clostridia bacterium]